MSDKQLNRKRRDYGSGSISQRRDGTWTGRLVIGRKPNGQLNVKAFYGHTEAEVKRKLKSFQKELAKNEFSVLQKNTVGNYMLNWLHNNKQNVLKPKSYDRLEQTLQNQVIPLIGHLQLASLQAEDIQKMVNDLRAQGLSYSTIKKAYDAVNDSPGKISAPRRRAIATAGCLPQRRACATILAR